MTPPKSSRPSKRRVPSRSPTSRPSSTSSRPPRTSRPSRTRQWKWNPRSLASRRPRRTPKSRPARQPLLAHPPQRQPPAASSAPSCGSAWRKLAPRASPFPRRSRRCRAPPGRRPRPPGPARPPASWDLRRGPARPPWRRRVPARSRHVQVERRCRRGLRIRRRRSVAHAHCPRSRFAPSSRVSLAATRGPECRHVQACPAVRGPVRPVATVHRPRVHPAEGVSPGDPRTARRLLRPSRRRPSPRPSRWPKA
jgi:hypothetical protein